MLLIYREGLRIMIDDEHPLHALAKYLSEKGGTIGYNSQHLLERYTWQGRMWSSLTERYIRQYRSGEMSHI